MKRLPFTIDDIIDLYMSGLTIKNVAKELGCSPATIDQRCRKANVRLSDLRPVVHNKTRKSKITLDHKMLKSRYRSGETKQSIADDLGVHINIVIRELEEAGIPRAKNQSEAMKKRLSRMSEDERKELTANANEAARGRKVSFKERCQRAKTRQKRGIGISKYEKKIIQWLEDAGIETTPQKALETYNIDIGIGDSIAVEVCGGNWHSTGKKRKALFERAEYLRSRSMNLVLIWINKVHHPLDRSVTDEIITAVNVFSSNPPTACKYRVIWGNGDFVTAGSLNDDNIALVPPYIGG